MTLSTVRPQRMGAANLFPRDGTAVAGIAVFTHEYGMRNHRGSTGKQTIGLGEILGEANKIGASKLSFISAKDMALLAILDTGDSGCHPVWVGWRIAKRGRFFPGFRVAVVTVDFQRRMRDDGRCSIIEASLCTNRRRRRFDCG